jgi:hypothetical protein
MIIQTEDEDSHRGRMRAALDRYKRMVRQSETLSIQANVRSHEMAFSMRTPVRMKKDFSWESLTPYSNEPAFVRNYSKEQFNTPPPSPVGTDAAPAGTLDDGRQRLGNEEAGGINVAPRHAKMACDRERAAFQQLAANREDRLSRPAAAYPECNRADRGSERQPSRPRVRESVLCRMGQAAAVAYATWPPRGELVVSRRLAGNSRRTRRGAVILLRRATSDGDAPKEGRRAIRGKRRAMKLNRGIYATNRTR